MDPATNTEHKEKICKDTLNFNQILEGKKKGR